MPPSTQPQSLHEKAIADLRYIRTAVQNAGEFTAVPGWGGVVMGVVGMAAAAVASTRIGTPQAWLTIWLTAAVVAVLVGLISMWRKSRSAGSSLVSAPARRFALAFVPAIVTGIALTAALVARGDWDLLPATWLLLYGVAVSAGGAMSVRVVPLMGAALLAIGIAALFVSFTAANAFLGLGFGLLHVVTGVVIARSYGG